MSDFVKTSIPHSCGEMRILHREVLRVGEEDVTYCLSDDLAPCPCYYVALTAKSDFRRLCLGHDPLFAVRVYSALIKGAVTPCTAADIVDDLSKDCL